MLTFRFVVIIRPRLELEAFPFTWAQVFRLGLGLGLDRVVGLGLCLELTSGLGLRIRFSFGPALGVRHRLMLILSSIVC